MEGIAGIIVSVATLVGAMTAAYVAIRNSRAASDARQQAHDAAVRADHARDAARDATREIVSVKGNLFEVGKAIDGRLSELLELTRAAARAEGRIEGHAAGVADRKAEEVMREEGHL